jgi:hypothetical protein
MRRGGWVRGAQGTGLAAGAGAPAAATGAAGGVAAPSLFVSSGGQGSTARLVIVEPAAAAAAGLSAPGGIVSWPQWQPLPSTTRPR